PAVAQCDHIEAAGFARPTRFGLEEQLRGNRQTLALAPVDALDRAAPAIVTTVADFDEYYCIAVQHNQIELPAPTAPVAADQAQPLPLQMAAGQIFCLPPTLLRRVACIHQYR